MSDFMLDDYMHTYEKVDELTWMFVTHIPINAGSAKRLLTIIKDKHREGTLYKTPYSTLVGSQLYYNIFLKFDNEGDEADFILRESL